MLARGVVVFFLFGATLRVAEPSRRAFSERKTLVVAFANRAHGAGRNAFAVGVTRLAEDGARRGGVGSIYVHCTTVVLGTKISFVLFVWPGRVRLVSVSRLRPRAMGNLSKLALPNFDSWITS